MIGEQMESWEEKREWVLHCQEKGILIASHRGKFSSSVMENSPLAFLTAIGEGADMVEMDLEETKDGVIVAHHDDTMDRLFHNPGKVGDYTYEEITGMALYNYVGEICVEKISTFEEILDALKDKNILVLDKCWDCWDKVYDLLVEHGMVRQCIFKFYAGDQAAEQWAENHPDCLFTPMMRKYEDLPNIYKMKEKMQLPALEILPKKPDEPVFRKETTEELASKGIRTWCNSLSLARRLIYGAGYDDLKSLYHGGDEGWGVLAERGVTIIQTDWPFELKRYLASRGLKA